MKALNELHNIPPYIDTDILASVLDAVDEEWLTPPEYKILYNGYAVSVVAAYVAAIAERSTGPTEDSEYEPTQT